MQTQNFAVFNVLESSLNLLLQKGKKKKKFEISLPILLVFGFPFSWVEIGIFQFVKKSVRSALGIVYIYVVF